MTSWTRPWLSSGGVSAVIATGAGSGGPGAGPLTPGPSAAAVTPAPALGIIGVGTYHTGTAG
jgi:hypothetical protein